MDAEFSAPVHVDGSLVVDLIDDEWAADTLPIDDVQVPAAALAPFDEDELAPLTESSARDSKWADLALHSFSSAVASVDA
jgi:chaperone required for assembly of F1-ATPase